MAFSIRVMCLDTHEELVQAWRAIIDAGMPADALAVLNDMSLFTYDEVGGSIRDALRAKNRVEEVRMARDLGAKLRAQYRQAAELARAVP